MPDSRGPGPGGKAVPRDHANSGAPSAAASKDRRLQAYIVNESLPGGVAPRYADVGLTNV